MINLVNEAFFTPRLVRDEKLLEVSVSSFFELIITLELLVRETLVNKYRTKAWRNQEQLLSETQGSSQTNDSECFRCNVTKM